MTHELFIPELFIPELFIKEELKRHPHTQPQDVLKMCFQSAFGAEHLISDIDRAENYFYQEFENTPADANMPLCEFLTPQVCRVNLAAWKGHALPPEWLFDLFINALAPYHPEDVGLAIHQYKKDAHATNKGEVFFNYVKTWSKFAHENEASLAFSFADFEETLEWYIDTCDGQLQAVHHSPIYKEAHHPAYRIISGPHVEAIPILQAAFQQLGPQGGVIAIDGPAGSGKSTLAGILSYILATPSIAMDHFFLPPALRTPERLAEIGGNIHHERFLEQVVPHFHRAFQYPIFDCRKMEYHGQRDIPPSKWHVVEGSYSHHPALGEYMGLKVFLDISPEEQLTRLEKRNPKLMDQFINQWIPMEEKYFDHYHIRENTHI